MGSIDFSPLVYLAVVGLVAIVIAVIALPFGIYWIWQHVSMVIR